MKTKKEEKECTDTQLNAKKEVLCGHHQAKRRKLKNEEDSPRAKRAAVDGPDHCIHCDDDPCAFLQIESRLCEIDTIFYNEDDYANAPGPYNSGRRKRAFQYAANVIYEGIHHRKRHYTCVEKGIRALFPPIDGKIMGFKND
jgi:hypothetical protein